MMENTTEKILCAAIHYDDGIQYEESQMYEGLCVTGFRHSDCHSLLEALVGKEKAAIVGRQHQGFLTNKNRYVGRKEAWYIAIKANQVLYGNTKTDSDSILISENLY